MDDRGREKTRKHAKPADEARAVEGYDPEPVADDSTVPQEDLVAFLDAEADPATLRRVEAELARNPELRRETELLEEAYQLLDFLPMPETKPDFTRRTATQAVAESPASTQPAAMTGEATQEYRTMSHTKPPVTRRPWLLPAWIAGLTCSLVLGLWVGYRGSQRSQALPADPQLLYHLEDYQQVGSLAFLKQLSEDSLHRELNRVTPRNEGSDNRGGNRP